MRLLILLVSLGQLSCLASTDICKDYLFDVKKSFSNILSKNTSQGVLKFSQSLKSFNEQIMETKEIQECNLIVPSKNKKFRPYRFSTCSVMNKDYSLDNSIYGETRTVEGSSLNGFNVNSIEYKKIEGNNFSRNVRLCNEFVDKDIGVMCVGSQRIKYDLEFREKNSIEMPKFNSKRKKVGFYSKTVHQVSCKSIKGNLLRKGINYFLDIIEVAQKGHTSLLSDKRAVEVKKTNRLDGMYFCMNQKNNNTESILESIKIIKSEDQGNKYSRKNDQEAIEYKLDNGSFIGLIQDQDKSIRKVKPQLYKINLGENVSSIAIVHESSDKYSYNTCVRVPEILVNLLSN